MRFRYAYTIGGARATIDIVTYERTITIDNTGNPESLDDTQIEITLTASNFDFTHTLSDGRDIRIYESDGVTLLPIWIKEYDQGAETATIFVKAQGIAAFSTGTLIITYGNQSLTTVSDKATTMETWVVGGDVTNLFTGIGTTIGVLDTYPAAGAISLRFTTPSSGFTGKRLFCKFNTASYFDFIDLFISASSKMVIRVTKNNVLKTVTGNTTIAASTEYGVTFSWDQMWKRVYLNGEIELKLFCDTPNNGSFAPFSSGALVTGQDATSEIFTGTITGGVIHNTLKQRQHARAIYEERKFYYKDEESKWIKNQAPAFSPSGAPVYEASVIYEGGVYKMWYGKIHTQPNRSSIYYASTTDLSLGFTEVQRVLGVGTGGESQDVVRGSVFKDGSTYYMYYIPYNGGANIGDPNHVYVVTSTDGITFSGSQIAYNKGATPGFQNTSVIKVGSTYHMYNDLDDGGLDILNRYKIGHATASSPLGPFTADPGNPLQSANYGDPTTTYGAAWVTYFNSTLWMWFLQVPPEETPGIVPTEIFRSISTDFTNFTKPYTTSVVAIDSYPDEFDQVSDPALFEENGNTWMVSADNDNGTGIFNGNTTFKAVINFHKFAGTMAQLVTDVSVSIGSET